MTTAPGTAGRVAELCGLRAAPLYGDAGAPVYDALCRYDRSELRDLLRLAQVAEGPILELACGSGRLTVPLAARGRRVVALDSSRALLRLLAQRAPRGRIDIVMGDMASFAFAERFDLVVLGTASVCLLGHDDRAELFRRVEAHLAPGGRFFVSGLDLADELVSGERDAERIHQTVLDGRIVTMYQHFSGRRGIRTTSVLDEVVRDGRARERSLLTSDVHLVSSIQLESELAAAGLCVVASTGAVAGEQRHFTMTCGREREHG